MNVAIHNLCFQGTKGKVLDNINFEMESGQCLVISGSSGSGKSLLLSIICGLIKPDSGDVFFDRLTMQQMTNEQDAEFRKRSSVVFQVPALLSNLTIAENLALPLIQYYTNLAAEERESLIANICQKFSLSSHLQDRVEQLSNGTQSIASLARALISEPELLMWDAALSGIDLQRSRQVRLILKKMKEEKKSLILFTNKGSLIDELADVHLHLKDGHLSAL